VRTSRDGSQLATTYEYDDLRRLTSVDPPGLPETIYAYATDDTGRATVTGTQTSGTLVVARSWLFDEFGRLILEKQTMPDNKWSARQMKYDALGRRTSASVLATFTDLASFDPPTTTNSDYDALGRAQTVTGPDGAITTFTYAGDRLVTRTANVLNPSGEAAVSTIEERDSAGRLITVQEDSTGINATTAYTYDGGDRLRSVTVAGSNQPPRSFTYDNRGLLTSETHPESGTATYEYDAAGHVVTRTTPVAKVTNTYDRAGRLLTVSAATPPSAAAQELKAFAYDRPNSGTDRSGGKLDYALRHNRGTPFGADVTVTETYTYKGPGGATSKKTTAVSTGQSFAESYDYDSFGNVAAIHYPGCTGCSGLTEPTRDITQTYDANMLEVVGGYANPIQYAGNGAVNKVQHLVVGGSGPVETQTMDSGLSRPASISVTQYCASFRITTEPQPRTVNSGSEAGLTVVAPGATSFQWFSMPGDVPVAETTSTLHATVTSATSFWVRVGNGTCTVDSAPALVSVVTCTKPTPTLTSSPASTMVAGSTGTASVAALSGATYAWIVTNGQITAGANTSSITFVAACGASQVTITVRVTACGMSSDLVTRTLSVVPPSATLAVVGSSVIQRGDNGTLRATLVGSPPWTATWMPGNVTQTVTTGTTVDRTVTPQTTTTYSVSVADANCSGTTSAGATITVVPPAPSSVAATASTATTVSISWNFSGAFDEFEIQRRLPGTSFATIGSSQTSPYIDATVAAGTLYLYCVRVRAGGTWSQLSAEDYAAVFDDYPVVAGSTRVKLVHWIQLRTAVNGMRALADLPAAAFTPIAIGSKVDQTDLQELRTALNQARSTLGLAPITYTDNPPVEGVTKIKATHVNELRGGVK
jgi:YD repeat-containing protein